MARLIEFSRRSTVQLQKILEFYDERNGNDAYSRRLLKSLLSDLQYSGAQKCLSPLRPFDCTSDNISVHLQNIYDTDELKKEATTEKISVVTTSMPSSVLGGAEVPVPFAPMSVSLTRKKMPSLSRRRWPA